MRGDYLGEFEQIVMLAVARLGDSAYGMDIRREIETRTGRVASLGAVYATLDRLTDKGALRVRQDDTGGGRPRWFFTLTPDGIAALQTAREIQTQMWAGLSLRRLKSRS
jgi:DNA-binding PadR family transcriptional regulator